MCQDFVEVVNEITFRKGNLSNFEVGDTGSFFRNVPLPPLFRPNDDVLSTTIELTSAQFNRPLIGTELVETDALVFTQGLTSASIIIGGANLKTLDQIIVFLNSKLKAGIPDWALLGTPQFIENPNYSGFLQFQCKKNFTLEIPNPKTRQKLGATTNLYQQNRTGTGMRKVYFEQRVSAQSSTVGFLVLNDEINSNFYNFNGGYMKYFAKFDSGDDELQYYGADRVTELPTIISSLEKLDIRFVDENYQLIDNSESDWSLSFVFKRKYKQPDTLELKPLITNKRGRFSY